MCTSYVRGHYVVSMATILQLCYLESEDPCKLITPHHLGSLQNILPNVFLAGFGLSGLAAVIIVTTEGLTRTAVMLHAAAADVAVYINSTSYTLVLIIII